VALRKTDKADGWEQVRKTVITNGTLRSPLWRWMHRNHDRLSALFEERHQRGRFWSKHLAAWASPTGQAGTRRLKQRVRPGIASDKILAAAHPPRQTGARRFGAGCRLHVDDIGQISGPFGPDQPTCL